MIKITVCKDCTDRFTACHDHCDKYLDAKRKLEEDKLFIGECRKNELLYADYWRKRKRSKKF